jgi:hypothetical protein
VGLGGGIDEAVVVLEVDAEVLNVHGKLLVSTLDFGHNLEIWVAKVAKVIFFTLLQSLLLGYFPRIISHIHVVNGVHSRHVDKVVVSRLQNDISWKHPKV